MTSNKRIDSDLTVGEVAPITGHPLLPCTKIARRQRELDARKACNLRYLRATFE